MDRAQKAESIETLKGVFADAGAVVVTHNLGLTVADMEDLRGRLRTAGGTFKVVKNRLALKALDAAEGARIVSGLKSADILFLANHGIIVTGPSIDIAFDDLYYLERACMLQVLGMGTGKPLRQVPDAIARKTAAQMTDDTQARLHFVALKRLLDRDEPGWSQL